ncbi:MAG: coproporphyrinogen dehydrogenase HemZ [Lachnospiraceae bacterium]|nr:coproporphyrinogen dehydrogenase HemZ [Lachnospiraceae bacterium]
MDKSIRIVTNDERFQYDIYSLFKAFYEKEDVGIEVKADINIKDALEQIEGEFFLIYVGKGVVAFEACEKGLISCQETERISLDDTKRLKNNIKRIIYKNLSRHLNKELPWGTLTGIRPVKLFMKGIDSGLSDKVILDKMSEEYLLSKERSELGLRIAHNESNILKSLVKGRGYSLYLGIPFCPSTCLYCSFTSYPIGKYKMLVGDYLAALKKEIDYVAAESRKNKKILETVYIGGGTPTTLSEEELTDLISYIKEKLDLSEVREFTLEAGRPDSITEGKLKVLKKMGVSRISINPQTMNDPTLKVIGRAHSVKEVYDAYKMARAQGFDNINMDLILGLPGEDMPEVKKTFEAIGELEPDSVTVHSLAIKRAAGMQEYLKENPDISLNNSAEIMDYSMNFMSKKGLEPYYLYRQKNMAGNYENVGYSKKGCEGLYNILIIEEVQSIVACGAGTVSKRVYTDREGRPLGRIERCDTVKDIKLYISRIDDMIARKKLLFKEEKQG